MGTTSACAENTLISFGGRWKLGNYLRVRGEYACACSVFCMAWELPPRARRIQQNGDALKQIEGTTSACAENTLVNAGINIFTGNYLRVRGEYKSSSFANKPETELPPRARRIRHIILHPVRHVGTTSACAENTHKLNSPP